MVKVESTPDGVHVRIDATDQDVNEGLFGADLISRDAAMVYPRGRGEKGVEVPIRRTAHGYTGDKVISYEELHKPHDEGTKIEVTVYDHDDDQGHGHTRERLTVSVAVSAGKSCERATEENPQSLDLSKKGGGRDLTDDELGGPMRSSKFFSHCALPRFVLGRHTAVVKSPSSLRAGASQLGAQAVCRPSANRSKRLRKCRDMRRR